MASRLVLSNAGPIPTDLLEDAKYLNNFEFKNMPMLGDQASNETFNIYVPFVEKIKV